MVSGCASAVCIKVSFIGHYSFLVALPGKVMLVSLSVGHLTQYGLTPKL